MCVEIQQYERAVPCALAGITFLAEVYPACTSVAFKVLTQVDFAT